jgi:hypothetical protein
MKSDNCTTPQEWLRSFVKQLKAQGDNLSVRYVYETLGTKDVDSVSNEDITANFFDEMEMDGFDFGLIESEGFTVETALNHKLHLIVEQSGNFSNI